jgi:hypothetical protein
MLPDPTANVQHPLASEVAQTLVGKLQGIERPTPGALVSPRDLGQIEVRSGERLRVEELSL